MRILLLKVVELLQSLFGQLFLSDLTKDFRQRVMIRFGEAWDLASTTSTGSVMANLVFESVLTDRICKLDFV